MSLLTIAPVWLAAARLPASVVPDLMPANKQPFWLKLRAYCKNACVSLRPSMYKMRMDALWPSSVSSYKPKMSVTSLWAELPTVTKELNGTPRRTACSAKKSMDAPEPLMKSTPPGIISGKKPVNLPA